MENHVWVYMFNVPIGCFLLLIFLVLRLPYANLYSCYPFAHTLAQVIGLYGNNCFTL